MPERKPNSLVASAKLLTAERIYSPKTNAWQEECWSYYDVGGELWFANLWLSNAMSKIRLFAAKPPQKAGDEPEPLDAGPAVDLMEGFAGGVDGQGAVLAETTIHLTVPGEGYLVGETDDDETSWRVYSNDELKVQKKEWTVRVDEKAWQPLPAESLVIKLWRPHARYHFRADSPTRHALPALREIQRCNDHIDATLVSRLAGAGLLIMPAEVQFPVSQANAEKEDPFFYELLDAMRAPITDRGVAGAVVPLPLRVPGERVEQFKHLTFATALDQKILDLREKAIRRFATTVDFPADILLGLTDANHWTAWQISEEGLQMHIEPLAEMICRAYTQGYLTPGMAALGQARGEAMIWYDSSELKVRPDRSADSRELFDRSVIGSAAVIRESGFDEADRPTEQEFREMVGWKLLAVRDMAPLGLQLLGLDVTALPAAPGTTPALPPAAPDAVPIEGPPSPGEPPPAPVQGPPGTQSTPPPPPGPDLPSRAATLLVADQFVYRALEKAGNRIRTLKKGKLGPDEDCPPVSMHQCVDFKALGVKAAQLLEGAWERVPEAAEALGEDPVKMQRALQRYCTQLYELGKQGDHTVERLAEFLADEMPASMASLAASGEGMSMTLAMQLSRSVGRFADAISHQPPPVTNVTIAAPGPRSRAVERDEQGNITRIIEEG